VGANKLMINSRYLLLAVMATAGLTGCDSGQADLERFVAETKLKHQGRVDPLPEFAEFESVVYTELGHRDPFKPAKQSIPAQTTIQSASTGPKPANNRRRELLESHSLDDLQMVGILEQAQSKWALVQDNEGVIHRVQPGNYLGENHGKITTITESKIKLVELIPDGISGWIQRNAQLTLGDE